MFSDQRDYGIELHPLEDPPFIELHYPDCVLIHGPLGKHYQITLTNRTKGLLYVVVSINGRSVINQREVSKKDEGIIIEPHRQVRIRNFLHLLHKEPTTYFSFSTLPASHYGFISAVFYTDSEDENPMYLALGYELTGSDCEPVHIYRKPEPLGQLTIYHSKDLTTRLPAPLPQLFPKDQL